MKGRRVMVTSFPGRKQAAMSLQANYIVTNARLWRHVCNGSCLADDGFYQKILPNYGFFEYAYFLNLIFGN
jgi:hypothetical protein